MQCDAEHDRANGPMHCLPRLANVVRRLTHLITNLSREGHEYHANGEYGENQGPPVHAKSNDAMTQPEDTQKKKHRPKRRRARFATCRALFLLATDKSRPHCIRLRSEL